MELVDQLISSGLFWVTLILLLCLALGVFFAPLGCWSRLATLTNFTADIRNYLFESKERQRETLEVQRQILAELKKLNKDSLN